MLIPRQYLMALPMLQQKVQLTSAQKGDTFETNQLLEVRGCLLENPWTDPLPNRHDFAANPNDPRFWDQDNDGNVGVTTLLDGIMRAEIYNVQRWKAIYHGTILSNNKIRGTSTIDSEELLIATSSGEMYDTISLIHEDPTRTFFRIQRMDEENVSCADLIREAKREDSWLKHSAHIMDPPCGPGEQEKEIDLTITINGEAQTVRRIQCVPN